MLHNYTVYNVIVVIQLQKVDIISRTLCKINLNFRLTLRRVLAIMDIKLE